MADPQTPSLVEAVTNAAASGSAADREEAVERALMCFREEGMAEDFEAVIFDVLPLLLECAGASHATLDGFTRLVEQLARQCNPREVITLVLALLDEAARYTSQTLYHSLVTCPAPPGHAPPSGHPRCCSMWPARAEAFTWSGPHAALLACLPPALARLQRRHSAFLQDCSSVVVQIVSRACECTNLLPSEPGQPAYHGHIQSHPSGQVHACTRPRGHRRLP